MDELRRLAESKPNFPVLIACSDMTTDKRAYVIGNAFAVEGPYALVPASVVYLSQP